MGQNTKNLGEIYKKKEALKAKRYFKTASVDGSWGSRGWTSHHGIVDVCFEEVGKVIAVTVVSARK